MIHKYRIQDNEEEYARYQPLYVETYMENGRNDNQSIAEWTESEGELLFPASEIYAPIHLAVAIGGSENNGYAIDLTKENWHAEFKAAVCGALIESGLAKAADEVRLEDVRRSSVEGRSLQEMLQVGVIYPTVNGVRTIDFPSNKTAGLGCIVKTPATHSMSKEYHLENYVTDLCARIASLCMNKLSKAGSMIEVERLVSKEDDPANLKHDIQQMIIKDGGVSGLPSFLKLVETHSDPDVIQAVRNGVISEVDIAADMTRIILDEVAQSMQARSSVVKGFYEAKELRELKATPSARTIYGSGTASAASQRIEAAMQAYPNATKLHREVLDAAFFQNDMLGCNLILSIKKSGCKGLRRRNAKRHEHSAAHMNGTKQHHPGHASHHLNSRRHRVRGETYRKLLESDIGRFSDAYHRSHQIRGLPRHPGSMEQLIGKEASAGLRSGGWGFFANQGNGNYTISGGEGRKKPVEEDEEDEERVDMRHAEEEPPSMAPGVVVEAEVPSLEPYMTKKATAPVASKVTPAPISAEVPSLEPYVKKTTQAKPINTQAPVAVEKKSTIPPLERYVPVTSSINAEQKPLASTLPTVVKPAPATESTLPSLASFVSVTTANNILSGPLRRAK